LYLHPKEVRRYLLMHADDTFNRWRSMLTTTRSLVCCYGPIVAVSVYLASAATNEMTLVFCLEENVDQAMQAHAMTAWLALHSVRLSRRKITLVARLHSSFLSLDSRTRMLTCSFR
jgi:hypothetical protein